MLWAVPWLCWWKGCISGCWERFRGSGISGHSPKVCLHQGNAVGFVKPTSHSEHKPWPLALGASGGEGESPGGHRGLGVSHGQIRCRTLSTAPKYRASKFPLRTPAQRLLCPDGSCFRSWPHSKELLVPPGWEEQQLGGHKPEGASAQGFSWDLREFDILFWSSVTVTYQGVC